MLREELLSGTAPANMGCCTGPFPKGKQRADLVAVLPFGECQGPRVCVGGGADGRNGS